MKINSVIKRLSALSMSVLIASTLSIVSFADNSSNTEPVKPTKVVATDSRPVTTKQTEKKPSEVSQATTESKAITDSNIATDNHEVEDKADTTDSSETEIPKNLLTGNADLIKEQTIIHDSSEMQFIAVTTKAGNVFYILIDYTATKDKASGEGSVYFLNKVDEQDLFALINQSSSTDSVADDLFYTESDDSYLNESTVTTSSVATESSLVSAENQSESETSTDSSAGLYIFLAIVCVGFVIAYYFLKIKPKKNELSDDDDDFEMEEREINEDEEM